MFLIFCENYKKVYEIFLFFFVKNLFIYLIIVIRSGVYLDVWSSINKLVGSCLSRLVFWIDWFCYG